MTANARALAETRPDEIALRDERVAFLWREVNDLLNRVTNGLLAESLGPQRRIAVFAENAAETILAHGGGMLAGCSVVPVSFHLTADEAAYILRDAGVQLLFVSGETAERGVEAARQAEVGTVIGWGEVPAGVVPWTRYLEGQTNAEPPADRKPLPNLLYTSGTTGRPKGTELPPTMFPGGETVAELLERLRENPLVDLGPHLVVGPLYHTGPLGAVRLLLAGCPVVVLGRFDAEKTLAAIDRYGAASSTMVPTHFVRLLALPEEVRARYDVSSLKRVAHTGAKCPVDVKRRMIEWFGPVIMEAYGASEVGTTCMIESDEWLAHPGSVGRAVEPFEAMILDDDGNPVGPGVEGRLYFRDTSGRGVVYHNDPEKSAAAHIAPGVFTLGEIAYMDEDGYVYITDRFSDMIVSGGVNIYPVESEQVLIEHPRVADVACIGIPHAEMGEELKALVVPEDPDAPPESRELIEFCRARLSHYKCPRSVDFVASVGRNTMGKVNKRQLRAAYTSAA